MTRHYYHVYADGSWQAPVREHLAALQAVTVPLHVTVGVVGAPVNRAAVLEVIGDVAHEVVEADAGWEQVTLHRLHADAYLHDEPVLYAHSKGASNPAEVNTPWRRCMTRAVVTGWRTCLDALELVDTVGAHWLDPAQYADALVESPFFAGNFWWARASYLRTLDPCSDDDRWWPERWVGLGYPVVMNLTEGWPSVEACTAHAVAP